MEIEILLKYIMKNCTEEEEKTVDHWIHASPQNEQRLQQIKNALDEQKKQQSHQLTVKEIENAWEKVYQRTINEIEEGHRIHHFLGDHIWVKVSKIAAVLVVGFLFVFLFSNNFFSSVNEMVVSTSTEKQEVLLPDGTTVWLNTKSSISYPEKFDGSQRLVKMTGEAYFDVEKNPEKPFIIQAENMKIEVIGTSFNINSHDLDNEQSVTVTSGKVAVSEWGNTDLDKITYLTKGEVARYNNNLRNITKSMNEDVNFLSWKSGELTFKDSSLKSIISDLQRHYQVEFIVEEEIKDDYSFNAIFRGNTLDEIISVLEISLGLELQAENNQIMIKKKETSF